jgi:hypothetical protein
MMTDVKIDKVEKEEKYIVVTINDGEIEMYIPYRGQTLDIIRSKFKINVPKKYTNTDLHVIQNQVYQMLGVTATSTEIE